ncbi:MAG: hypothetical protein JO261_10285 [Alphaproteobacteria bacterium]|nr:hypothetical protein [Alphaproteobacteria bacterium]MBV9694075.1 hypothetical protein [Alphaproteobacteria bacterium]
MAFIAFAAGLSATPLLAADAGSVAADGTVTIRPGEAFEIAFADGDDLSHPKFSRVLDHLDQNVVGWHKPDPNAPSPSGPRLMSFEFQNEGASLKLLVRNDTGVAIKYDATMVAQMPDGKLVSSHTSVCPSFPGMLGNELWAQPIVMLKLSKFQRATEDSFVCE